MEHLPCPLALSLERFCGLYFESLQIASFREIWNSGSDPIRLALKRGLSGAREGGLFFPFFPYNTLLIL